MLVADRHPCLSPTLQDWHNVRLAPLALLTFLTATQCRRLPTCLCHLSWTMMVLATGVPLSMRLSPSTVHDSPAATSTDMAPPAHSCQIPDPAPVTAPPGCPSLPRHRDALPVAPSSRLGTLTILCDLSI